MRVIEYGEHALLVEVDDPRDVPLLRGALADLDGVVDAVAGARTVLVDGDRHARAAVRAALDRGEFAAARTEKPPRSVDIEVRYDGPDLGEIAAEAGCSPNDVIAMHCRPDYVVRFCGFAPGFAYLDGLDERLHVPRRAEPRTRVPAGAVGIAGEFTGVYPRESPGGWRLLGQTDARLWDVTRDPPALLMPGTVVRFRPT